MVDIKEKEQCCGCGACYQACPKKCIEMSYDTEGFAYPLVDKTVCVGCNLCDHVCPMEDSRERGNSVNKTYVAYHKDISTRLMSSSGGCFSAFAEYVLTQGGIVFGAAFDSDHRFVHHVSITKSTDLNKLRGSKYIQSRTEQTYVEVKNYLNLGKLVLYSGTGCQISGLKQFLGNKYDNLYTVDILCHGIPSQKVWNLYLDTKELTYKGDIHEVHFRKKDAGWKRYNIEIQFDASKIYKHSFTEDTYGQIFLKNICLRPSCYDCKFKPLERDSDITIGDCWGIDKFLPKMDDDKGTSVAFIHSRKGEELFNAVSSQFCFSELEADKAVSPSAESRCKISVPYNRNRFFKLLNAGASIERLRKETEVSMARKCWRKFKAIVLIRTVPQKSCK